MLKFKKMPSGMIYTGTEDYAVVFHQDKEQRDPRKPLEISFSFKDRIYTATSRTIQVYPTLVQYLNWATLDCVMELGAGIAGFAPFAAEMLHEQGRPQLVVIDPIDYNQAYDVVGEIMHDKRLPDESIKKNLEIILGRLDILKNPDLVRHHQDTYVQGTELAKEYYDKVDVLVSVALAGMYRTLPQKEIKRLLKQKPERNKNYFTI
ncbi:hypothetical protein H6503_01960 [Candidatus Woesearchaeota archaeon]|nr:hypothetical protein [Candidatus Woesearchaeota archaeon]